MKIKVLILAAVMLFCSFTEARCGQIQEAQEFFNNFVCYTNTYSPQLLGLYGDNAKIVRMVLDGDDYTQLNVPIDTYKSKLKFYSKMAKLLKYKNYYSGLKFIAEGKNVRIKGQRTPTTGGGAVPMQMLLGQNPSGDWEIKEEVFYTKSKAFLKFIH